MFDKYASMEKLFACLYSSIPAAKSTAYTNSEIILTKFMIKIII
jgi:hypothetical protein